MGQEMQTRSWFLCLLGWVASQALSDQCGNSSQCHNYQQARAGLVNLQQHLSFDRDIVLTPLEQQATRVLLKLRDREAHLYNPRDQYNPQQTQIESGLFFNALKRMPKGAVLHIHSIGSIDLAVQALQREDCYVSFDPIFMTDGLQVTFNTAPPPSLNIWSKCTEQTPFAEFEQRVRKAMLFTSPNSSVSKTDMWELFDATIGLATTPLLYEPYFELGVC